MLTKAKIILLFASLTMVSAASFASGDVASGIMGIYHHVIKPIPGWVSDAAKGAKDRTIMVKVELDKDGRAIGTAFYKEGGKVKTKVIDPVVDAAVRTTVAAIKFPTYDIFWKVILVPAKEGAVAAWNADVLTGFKAIGTSEASAGENLGKDLKADRTTFEKKTVATYDETAVPMYKGTKAAGTAIYHGTITVICGDQGCSGI